MLRNEEKNIFSDLFTLYVCIDIDIMWYNCFLFLYIHHRWSLLCIRMIYKCRDQACREIYNSFESIVNHRTRSHANEPIEFLKLSVSAQTSSNQWNNLKYEIVPSEGTVIIDCDTNKIRFKRKQVTHSSETTNHQNDNESSETSDIDEKKITFGSTVIDSTWCLQLFVKKNYDIHAERLSTLWSYW